jgi:hypothetical protein
MLGPVAVLLFSLPAHAEAPSVNECETLLIYPVSALISPITTELPTSLRLPPGDPLPTPPEPPEMKDTFPPAPPEPAKEKLYN